jgi:20S proteasome subunit beta 2
MGSGSLAAMAMLEMGYKDGLTEAEAKALVTRAIRAGIFNDLGSGSNVDLTIIRESGDTEILRGYEKPNSVASVRAKALRPSSLSVPIGATATLKETFTKFIDVTDISLPSVAGSAAP